MRSTLSRGPADWANALIDWMDERVAIRQIASYALHVSIPRSAHTYYLGGITLFFFMVQAITGILLALYYHPTPEAAYDSVLFIMNDVNFGWLVRSIHAWSANLMIVFCVLHLLRVALQGAYRAPREMTWFAGVGLLLLTLGFGFTGYLLPWDERAFWATTVGTQIAGAVPLVGDYIQEFLRGGPDLSALTLSRFFDVHVLILPASLVGLLGMHLLFIHQQGLADPEERSQAPHKPKQLLPFWPHYMLSEFIAWYVMLAALLALASLMPADLQATADAFRTPPDVKPEWYFLFLYQLLKDVAFLSVVHPELPKLAGITLPAIGLVLLTLLPFLDRSNKRPARERPLMLAIVVIILLVILFLTVRGALPETAYVVFPHWTA